MNTEGSENKNNRKEVRLSSEFYTIDDDIATIDIEALNAAGVLTSCNQAFAYEHMKLISNLHELDTSHVTDMSSMFEGCSSLETLDLSSFQTYNVDDMTSMFYGCKSLERLNLQNFSFDELCEATCMFAECTNLKSLVIGFPHNLEVLSSISAYGMFENCTSLQNLAIDNFGPSISTARHMFRNCLSLDSLDISRLEFKESERDDFKDMFENCFALRELILSKSNYLQILEKTDVLLNRPYLNIKVR